MAYPVVGDVAKLDMLNMATWLIQWLVMWQSWICSIYVATWLSYPVVGDVAKLDMLNICIQWLVMWQSWIYASMLFAAYSFSWGSKQYTL